MQREIIRVEPIDSNFEKWGAPVSTCTAPATWCSAFGPRADQQFPASKQKHWL